MTVDTPLTGAQLDAAEQMFDRLIEPVPPDDHSHGTFRLDADALQREATFTDLADHPFFLSVAQQVLRTGDVRRWGNLHSREPTVLDDGDWPSGSEIWGGRAQHICGGCHVDVQMTADDFTATPRRECSLGMWLWLTDVTAPGGAMRLLPGSHLRIGEHWQTVLSTEQRAQLPRVRGLRPDPVGWCEVAKAAGGDFPALPHYPEGIAEPPGERWCEQEPVAAVARRGQMLCAQDLSCRLSHLPHGNRLPRLHGCTQAHDVVHAALGMDERLRQ